VGLTEPHPYSPSGTTGVSLGRTRVRSSGVACATPALFSETRNDATGRERETLARRATHAAARGSDNGAMEPIASSGAGAVFRPPGGAGSDAAALLRNGRVLSAEVLARSGDNALLLAIGRQVIPAESDLQLDLGARFLVRVDEGTDGVVLKILSAGGEQEESL